VNRKQGAFLGFLLLFACSDLPALEQSEILLVVHDGANNSKQAASLYLSYYPSVRTFYITDPNAPKSELITREQYETYVRDPILQHLTQQDLWDSIQCILTTKGVPFKISEWDTSDGDYESGPGFVDRASVDSELTLLPYDRIHGNHSLPGFLPNPYFGASLPFDSATYGMFLVGRLTAYDLTDLAASLERAQNPSPHSTAWTVLDDVGWRTCDHMPEAWAAMKDLDQKVLPDPWSTAGWITTAPGEVIGYCSYGRNADMPPTYILDGTLEFTYAPGAVFNTYESYNAWSFTWTWRNGQGLVADFLRMGGTAGLGHTWEPYCDGVANEDILFPRLAQGYSFIEAAYMAIDYVSWMNVVVGDPLMRYPDPPDTPTPGPTLPATATATALATCTPTPTVSPTSSPAPTPYIIDVARDKTQRSMGDWIDITFITGENLWYDILTSAGLESPSWSYQGSIQALGPTATYRDPGPVHDERYYRIEVQGSHPKSYSPNWAGVLPVEIQGKSEEEVAQLAFLGVSLDPTGGHGIQEVVGWQLQGGNTVDEADEIWKWSLSHLSYQRNWLFDSQDTYPAYDGLWIDLAFGHPSSMEMAAGEGFWVRNKSSLKKTLVLQGLTGIQPVSVPVWVSSTERLLHMMGQPYPVDLLLDEQNTGFVASGARGGMDASSADEIWAYDTVGDGYSRQWLFDSEGIYSAYDGIWFDLSTGAPSSLVLRRGTGWWYRTYPEAERAGSPSWIWTAPVPF